MPAFAITTTTPAPALGRGRRGEVSFTVANQSDRTIKGRAEIRAQDPAQASWLRLGDAPEREFPPQGKHQFVVTITVPEGAPGGTCTFRLDMISTSGRLEGDTSAGGPTVSVTIPPPPAVPNGPRWWIVAVAAGVILVVGGTVLAWLLWPRASGCRDGSREGLVDEERFPDIAACAGEWQGFVGQANSLCEAKWKVCDHQSRALKTVAYKDATEFPGCFAYNAAQDNDTCTQCGAGDASRSDDMAGMGRDCRFQFADRSGCMKGVGRIDVVCCDDFRSGTACHHKPNVTGVVCCRS